MQMQPTGTGGAYSAPLVPLAMDLEGSGEEGDSGWKERGRERGEKRGEWRDRKRGGRKDREGRG